MSNKASRTESISTRIDSELKRKLFEHLEAEEKVFSKWLRNIIRKELKKAEDKKK